VGDAETPVSSLTVSGTSDNTGVIPDANIVISGTGAARTVQVSPAPNQSGAAIITLSVNDGTISTTTTFQVTINTVNDAPTITAIGNQATNEDTPTGVLPFTIGDVETAVASLTVTATSDNIVLVPNANIAIGGAGASQTIQITPVANQFGVATITVNVNDGVNTTTTAFQVTVSSVNDLPTISAIADQSINEDIPTGALVFTVGDTETAVGSLTLTGSSDNVTLVPNANIVFGGTGASRTVTVTPAANQVGVAVVTITVNDGSGNATRSFTLTVDPINDLPSITSQVPLTITEEQPYDIQFTDLIVTDVDNAYPTGFSLTVLGNPGYTAAGTIITPNTNVTGNIVVRVQVGDGAGGLSNIYNVTVTVSPVNDTPTITNQAPLTVNEDNPITIMLANLTIVDPDNASGFTFSLAGGSNYTVAGNVVTPALNFNGTLTVPVTASDGNSSSAPYPLIIQVNPVNDKPEITSNVLISVAEVQPVAIDLTQLIVFDPDDTYPDDFTLFVLGGTNYTASGNTITPVANFSGTLVVRVFVSDGEVNSDTYNLQILVNSTNDAPVITGQMPDPLTVDEGQPITILLSHLLVTDPDNPFPTGFTLNVLNSANYTFTGNTVVPAPNVTGLLLVKVKVSDGSVDSAPYDVKVNVANVNDAPVISGQQNVTVLEDNSVTLRISDLIVTDPDSPSGSLTMTAVDGPNYSIVGLDVTPDANFVGDLFVPVVVSDGMLNSQPYDLRVVVTAVNDAPKITGNVALSTMEDQPLTLKFSDFTVTDVDNTYPTGFTLIVQGGGNHTVGPGNVVIPNPNFSGTLDVGVYVSDGALTSGIHSTSIIVNNINDAPTIDLVTNVTIQEDPTEISVISFSGISTGIGEGGQSLTVTASSNHPEWFEPFEVQYTSGANGSLRIKPKANIFGTAQITVRVEDNGTATPPPNINFIEQTFSFIIDPVNDPPTFTSEPAKLVEAGTLYEYLIVATDIESEVITITAPTLPAWLTLTPASNGNATLSGTVPIALTGAVPVQLHATDPTTIPAAAQLFEIVINSRPIITSFTITTDEDKTYKFAKEFSNSYTDIDANALIEIHITTLPKKGVLTLNGSPVPLNAVIPVAQLENLLYVPTPDSTGTDVIGWNASDGIYLSTAATTATITISPVNDPPEIIALEAPEADTLKYELGSEIPVKLTRIFDARDAENDNITSAEIGFAVPVEYRELRDQFLFTDTLGITGSFNEKFGILTLSGTATVKDYVAAIRAVRYNYVDVVVSGDDSESKLTNRRVSIKLTSSNVSSPTKDRLVGLIYTYQELDIANAFAPSGNMSPHWRIHSAGGLERYKDAQIKVYNRRGVLVYEATGFSVPWTGVGTDGDLPADTYFYTIDLKYDKKKYKGAVTILR
jgi:gliding motility-associated-like protein